MSLESDILHSLESLSISDIEGAGSQKQTQAPSFHIAVPYPQQRAQPQLWKKMTSTDAALVALATLLDVHSIYPSPISLLVQPSVSFKSKQCAFKKILDSAYRSQNAIDILIANFPKISSIFQGDRRYSHLLENIKLLLDQAQHLSKANPKDIRMLLEATFIDSPANGGLTIAESYHLSAQMLFLDAIPLPDTSLQALLEAAERETTIRLSSLKDEYQETLEQFKKLGIYREELLHTTQLPYAIAKAILLPNGKLNVGIISDVKHGFLKDKEHRDSTEKHMAALLEEISSDKKLQQAIETIPLPGPSGALVINASLMRPHFTKISLYETRLVCIAACLTYWRQHHTCSCVLDSLLQEKQANGLRWLVDDFKEILSKGYLTRQLQGTEIRFLGLPIPENLSLDTQLKDPTILSRTSLGSSIQDHLRLDGPQWASALQKNPSSLRNLITIIHNDFPAKVTVKDIDQTLLLIESPTQAPLLRVVENALGSVFCPPCSPYKKPLLQNQTDLLRDLFDTFASVTQEYFLPELYDTIQEFRDFLELDGQSGLSLSPPAGTALVPFERIRVHWSPSAAYDARIAQISGAPGTYTYFFENEDSIQPISKNEFEAFLFNMFQNLFREVYGPIPLPSSITPDVFSSVGRDILGAFCTETRARGLFTGSPVFERSYPRLPHQETGPLEMTNRGLLQWLHHLGESQKSDISFLAATSNPLFSHGFRLLPNTSSVRRGTLFSLEHSLLSLDDSTRRTIDESFQHLSLSVKRALVNEYVAKCTQEVRIPIPGGNLKLLLSDPMMHVCQRSVAQRVSTCSFSIQECCLTIPMIVRTVIAETVLFFAPPQSPIRAKSLESIRDTMQLAESVNHFLFTIYSRSGCRPLPSLFPQTKEDPLFRIENLSSEFIRTPVCELPDFPNTLSKLYTTLNKLVERACQCITFPYWITTKTVQCSPSEIQLIQCIVKRKIGLDAQNHSTTVRDIVLLIEKYIKEEIIQTIRNPRLRKDSFGIGRVSAQVLLSNMQISLQASDIHYQCLIALSENHPRYRDLFIHFGDSNWGALLSGRFLAIHLCLWYDPIDEFWPIVTAPESGELDFNCGVTPLQPSDILLVDPPRHPIEEAQRKDSLLTQKKAEKKKQALERAFADSLSVFQQRFCELDAEQQHRMLLQPSPIAPRLNPDAAWIKARVLIASATPKDLPSALQRCQEIVTVYQAVLQLAAQK